MIRALALVLAAGCVEHVQLASDSLPGLVEIDVTPPTDTLSITLPGAPQTIRYTANGKFADGAIRDITAQVQWTTDDPAVGVVTAPATYVTTNAAAGHVTIRAAHRDVAGTSALTVVISETIVDDAFPPPVTGLFAPGRQMMADPMRSPSILYPADATMFPQAVEPPLFQLRAGMMTDAYQLSFDSDVLHVKVQTGADRWRADAATWELIAASNRAEAVMFQADAALSTAPGTVYTGASETLDFAAAGVDGAIFYDAATTNGILEADLAMTVASEIYPPSTDPAHAANQTISRDGRTMALAYNNNLETVALATLLPQAMTTVPAGWMALSPDGSLVMVANMGMLALRDAMTGNPIGPPGPGGHIMLPPMQMATHPDWSPDGTALVIATGTNVTNMDLKGGSIMRVAYKGMGMWGPPQMIVMSTGDTDNNFFPRWSPDGNYIAYVHTDGPANAPTAELRLVPATGGAPVVLARASHRLATMDGVPGLGNTMPAWAPWTAGPMWLAFASARPYGSVRPMVGGSQIWIAGIDVTQGDPSFAAFWLAAQDVTAANSEPSWGPHTGAVTDAR